MDHSSSLSGQTCQAIDTLLGAQAPWNEPAGQRLHFHGAAPPFDSPHKLTMAAASALGAHALATERRWQLATGQRQETAIHVTKAATSLNPGHFHTRSASAPLAPSPPP